MNNEKDTVLRALEELTTLINTNIKEDGICSFDAVKAQVVLEFAKTEIQKSMKNNPKKD